MPPKKEVLHECIILKAFLDQKECVMQLKNKESIKKIAGTHFSFPRNLIDIEDSEVHKNKYFLKLAFTF